MDILLYFIIFLLKIAENTLATLRTIFISNGKKWLGAILIFIISILWAISGSIVIINIGKDIFMLFIYSLGSFVGSYVGSFMEEKIALGNQLVICISEKELSENLRENGYIVTDIRGIGMESLKNILFIVISRKKRMELVNLITKFDPSSIVISEYTSIIYSGNQK